MNSSAEASFIDQLQTFISYYGNNLWAWIVLPVLAVLGIYMTLKLKVVQLTLIPEMFRILFEKTKHKTTVSGRKPISAFQAFSISAASRVGVGNIAGVGTAIAVGGAGSIFWMWAMAFVGGASSFVESTLAQVYKVSDKNGFRGGPAYYMQYGLRKKWIGVVFAIILILCFPFAFSALQANTITEVFASNIGIEQNISFSLIMGAVLAFFVGLIIFGGVQRIASVTQSIVPVMATLYIFLGLLIVVLNITEIPRVFSSIFLEAFGLTEFSGGLLGTIILTGVKRGMFSNEAGLGSAPNASATADVTHPVKQGLIQTLGVYFDTFLICSITAFIILVSTPNLEGASRGISLTYNALDSNLGSWATLLLVFIIFLLAFSSILGNYYYGESNLEFITNNNKVVFGYRLFAILSIFMGTILTSDFVWDLGDAIMGIMAFINLLSIAALSSIPVVLLKDYIKQRKDGLDPQFDKKLFPQIRGIQSWND